MITIIGAGPVGSYTAYLLKKKGIDVNVYEDHKLVGEPVQCSGIITSDINKIINLDDKLIVNRFDYVKVHSKKQSVTLRSKDILVDRKKFDNFMFKKAKKEGVKFFFQHKYLGKAKGKAVFANKKNKLIKINTDKLIGADGPLSETAKSVRIFSKREFYVGLQARIKGKFKKNTYEVYLGSICPGFFAWIIPESDKIARIGVASKRNVADIFSKFISVKGFDNKDIIEKQGGLIPVWNKKIKVSDKAVYLVGDAAAQVKATTGGGLVPGLRAAKILVNSIANNSNYSKNLVKVNKELNRHLMIRNILDRFSNKDYDQLIKLINTEKVRKILGEYSRDSSSKLLFKLGFAEPRFGFYLRKIIVPLCNKLYK